METDTSLSYKNFLSALAAIPVGGDDDDTEQRSVEDIWQDILYDYPTGITADELVSLRHAMRSDIKRIVSSMNFFIADNRQHDSITAKNVPDSAAVHHEHGSDDEGVSTGVSRVQRGDDAHGGDLCGEIKKLAASNRFPITRKFLTALETYPVSSSDSNLGSEYSRLICFALIEMVTMLCSCNNRPDIVFPVLFSDIITPDVELRCAKSGCPCRCDQVVVADVVSVLDAYFAPLLTPSRMSLCGQYFVGTLSPPLVPGWGFRNDPSASCQKPGSTAFMIDMYISLRSKLPSCAYTSAIANVIRAHYENCNDEASDDLLLKVVERLLLSNVVDGDDIEQLILPLLATSHLYASNDTRQRAIDCLAYIIHRHSVESVLDMVNVFARNLILIDDIHTNDISNLLGVLVKQLDPVRQHDEMYELGLSAALLGQTSHAGYVLDVWTGAIWRSMTDDITPIAFMNRCIDIFTGKVAYRGSDDKPVTLTISKIVCIWRYLVHHTVLICVLNKDYSTLVSDENNDVFRSLASIIWSSKSLSECIAALEVLRQCCYEMHYLQTVSPKYTPNLDLSHRTFWIFSLSDMCIKPLDCENSTSEDTKLQDLTMRCSKLRASIIQIVSRFTKRSENKSD